MQNKKILLSVTIVAALLVAPAVMAQVASCTTSDQNWTVTLESINVVSDGIFPSGAGLKADYTVEGALEPNLVVQLHSNSLVLVTSAQANGAQLYFGTEGDPQFGLGGSDQTTNTLRVDDNDAVRSFSAWFDMTEFILRTRPTIIKHGSKGRSVVEGQCALAAPEAGSADDPLATVELDETEVIGGKCIIQAKSLPNGKAEVKLLGGSDPHCDIDQDPLFPDGIPPELMTITFPGDPSPQPVMFNGGGRNNVIISGTGTCAWKQYWPNRGNWWRICW